MKTYIGIDIGGTKIEAQVFKNNSDLSNGIPKSIATKRIQTRRLDGSKIILENINLLIRDILEDAQLSISELNGIGIGLPGSVSPTTQMMIKGNTAILVGLDISKSIKEFFKVKLPISVNNDANCFAYAEVIYGAGLEYKKHTNNNTKMTGIGIILGTGLGGGVIIDSKILVGKNGGAAELGHIQFIQDGVACYCGRSGCSEQYLSGTALESQFNSKKYHALENKIYSSKEIFSLAQDCEPLAISTVLNYKKNLAKFLANLTNIFDPDFFVLGGGVSNQDIIYKNLEEELSKLTFLEESNPKVYKNILGDSSGALGAICELIDA